MRGTVTRIGAYCFDVRIAGAFVMGALAVFAVAPPIIQAFLLMFIGTCPITAIAGICKVSRLHVCSEEGWAAPSRMDEEEGRIETNPYAGLASGMFGGKR